MSRLRSQSRLKILEEFLHDGILTQAEFARAKMRLLAGRELPPDVEESRRTVLRTIEDEPVDDDPTAGPEDSVQGTDGITADAFTVDETSTLQPGTVEDAMSSDRTTRRIGEAVPSRRVALDSSAPTQPLPAGEPTEPRNYLPVPVPALVEELSDDVLVMEEETGREERTVALPSPVPIRVLAGLAVVCALAWCVGLGLFALAWLS